MLVVYCGVGTVSVLMPMCIAGEYQHLHRIVQLVGGLELTGNQVPVKDETTAMTAASFSNGDSEWRDQESPALRVIVEGKNLSFSSQDTTSSC